MAMGRAIVSMAIMLFLLAISLVKAQAPTPPTVATLGPAVICSAGDNIVIFSPQNDKTFSSKEIQLNFTLQAMGMFGQFGNVGYNLDGGTIYSVNDFVNKSVDHPTDAPDWYWNRTTVFASIVLPNLSEGVHNVTVYYGYQYLGTNNPSLERFEVWAYSSAIFAVADSQQTSADPSSSPSPSSTTFIAASLEESASSLSFGNTINFTVTVEAGNAPYAYAWYVDNQLSETNNIPYYSTDEATVGSHHIYVKVTDADNNSATTLTVEFNVLPTLSNSPSLSPGPSSSPTQRPTTELSLTPNNTQDNSAPFAIAVGLVITGVFVTLLVALAKHRGKRR